VKFKKGETVIYPQHGACVVQGTKKMEAFGERREYLVLRTVINEMTLKVPVDNAEDVGIRPPVSADELEDLVSVLAKPDPRVPSNWSRRFKNHQEKLKSGDVYQVAEVVRNLAARNRDASLSAAERTMYEKARVNLVSEISPALRVSTEEAEDYLDQALARGVLRAGKAPKSSDSADAAPAKKAATKPAPAAKEPAKKAPVTKVAAKKAPAKKVAAKKAPAKKAAAKKVPAKKVAAKKAPAKKAAAKK
jgi:CarD family transcriptional regulator